MWQRKKINPNNAERNGRSELITSEITQGEKMYIYLIDGKQLKPQAAPSEKCTSIR